jgi:sulfite exporter TauE/SafE
MIGLVATVFLASLLGSLHCAGMCGAFLALAVCGTECTKTQARRAHASYHLGRLVSYTAFGGVAGVLGQSLDLAAAFAGVQGAAAGVAAGSMILFGLLMLLRTLGTRLPRIPVPAAWTAVAGRMHRLALDQPPALRAVLIGVFTVMLPCGWLWAFALVAAGTASAWSGALVMSVFWLGTLPMLVAMGTSLRAVGGWMGRRMPVFASIALVLAGVATLAMRVALTPRLANLRLDMPAISTTSTSDIVSSAAHLARQTPVCCDAPAQPANAQPATTQAAPASPAATTTEVK